MAATMYQSPEKSVPNCGVAGGEGRFILETAPSLSRAAQRTSDSKTLASTPGSLCSSPHAEFDVQIADFSYRIHRMHILSFEEAEGVYMTMKREAEEGVRRQSWSDVEVQLLQWVVINYAEQNEKGPAQFNAGDWEKICTIVPGRSRVSCRNKWNSTQNASKANKTLWTEEEDKVLKQLVKEYGTKHWTVVATNFNKRFPEKDRRGKQCRDRWLNYLDPEIKKTEITVIEKFNLCYNWLKLKNSWVKIARTMGRTENWVKNNWKKLLKKEGISPAVAPEELAEKISKLMEALRTEGQITELPPSSSSYLDASYADVPEELELSDSASKPVLSETSFKTARKEPDNPRAHIKTRRTKFELMKATIQDSQNALVQDDDEEEKEDEQQQVSFPMNQEQCCMTDLQGIYVNTESDEYDFAANTSESPGPMAFGRDVSKYATKSQRGTSPFETHKRTII